MQDSFTKVLENLYIGDKQFSKDLDKLRAVGITHVVNVTTEIRNYYEKDVMFSYFKCPVMDTESAVLSEYFDAAAQFIHEARQTGHSVLVHCQQGVSRSSTIVLAYLIKYEKMKVVQAYTLLRSLRPQARPKSNFLSQLMKFEKQLSAPVPSAQNESKTEESRKRKDFCGPTMPSVGPSLPSSSSISASSTSSTSSSSSTVSSSSAAASTQQKEEKEEESKTESHDESEAEAPLKKSRLVDDSGDVVSKEDEATNASAPATTPSHNSAALGETEIDPRESAA